MAYVSNVLTQSSTTGGATVVLTLPPHVANDVIVVCVSADGGGTLSATWGGNSAATGQVGSTQTSGALLSGAVFYARATGTAATCTINMGTADAIHVHMVILKDVDTTTHLDASNVTTGSAATQFTTASVTTTTADCLILYYVAGDDATTTPHAIHSRPGPTATMHFLDSSDNGGTTVTTLASGALGWYAQRATGATPQPEWDQSSSEVYASFVMAWRNVSGGVVPPYVDDAGSLGQQLMTGSWWASATTRNNQNFKATPLTYGNVGVDAAGLPTTFDAGAAVVDAGRAPCLFLGAPPAFSEAAFCGRIRRMSDTTSPPSTEPVPDTERPAIQNPMMAWVRGGTRTAASERMIAEQFARSERARAVADREHQLASIPVEQGGAMMPSLDLNGPAGATYVYIQYVDRHGNVYIDGIADIGCDSDGTMFAMLMCTRCFLERGLHADQSQLKVAFNNRKFEFVPGPPKFKIFDDGFGPQRYRIAGSIVASEKFKCDRCDFSARFDHDQVRED